jgi:hypothetical protein
LREFQAQSHDVSAIDIGESGHFRIGFIWQLLWFESFLSGVRWTW